MNCHPVMVMSKNQFTIVRDDFNGGIFLYDRLRERKLMILDGQMSHAIYRWPRLRIKLVTDGKVKLSV